MTILVKIPTEDFNAIQFNNAEELGVEFAQEVFDRIVASEEIIDSLPSVTSKQKTGVLDKIREEIEQAYCKVENDYDKGRNYGLYMATQIIDNYKLESEEKE